MDINWLDINWLTIVMACAGSLVTAGISIGVFKTIVDNHGKALESVRSDINMIFGRGSGDLETPFIKRSECQASKGHSRETLESLQKQLDSHGKAINRIENFSIWYLTTKENLSLTDAQRLLNNGR